MKLAQDSTEIRQLQVRKFRLGEEPKDYEYWLTRPQAERVAAATQIIQSHHGWDDATEPRLARVSRVLKR